LPTPLALRLALSIILAVLLGAPPAFAQQHPEEPPSRHTTTLQDRSQLPVQSLAAVDAEQLRKEDRRRAGEIRPYRYGVVREVNLTPPRNGTWERLDSGDWVWRTRIFSRNAQSLSVGFTSFDLPRGAQVFLYGPADELVRGPYTAEDATNGQHWTPHVRGAELVVELVVPSGAREAVDLTIGRVIHAYRPLHPSRAAPDASAVQPKSGACNVDVACEEADPWRDQVRSVASYSFTSGAFGFVCSGALVNNTAQDLTPYFLTAEHCISTSEEAASMVFYWNFESPTCRDPGSTASGGPANDDRTDQTSSGAVLRAAYGNTARTGNIAGRPDIALVEIDDVIPSRYDVFFAGWSRATDAPAEGVSIHHPNGDAKRIAIDADPLSITDYADFGNEESTHLLIEAWEVGTTEGGSSGAPLFNPNGRIVGVLSGGSAGCTGTGEDNDRPDWYGRVTPAWEGGASPSAQLSAWLDPTGTNPGGIGGVNQSTDNRPPGPVRDLTVDAVDPTAPSVTLSWTAGGDDGDGEGAASRYDVRASTDPIVTAGDFQAATSLSGPPTPSAAGARDSFTVELPPGAAYYFAVQARDEAENASPIVSTPDSTFLPDVIPPSPVGDLRVASVSGSSETVTLSWTAVGDDRDTRTAAAYDLRFDTAPIRTEADFQTATPVMTLPSPQPPGTDEQVVLDELDPGVAYYFALRVTDDAGNRSPVRSLSTNTIIVKGDVLAKSLAPNPTSDRTRLRLSAQETQDVTVELYDRLGRLVQRVYDAELPANREETIRLDTGRLAAGIYFVHIMGDAFVQTKTLSVVH
jgi:lysyl endopeptidase